MTVAVGQIRLNNVILESIGSNTVTQSRFPLFNTLSITGKGNRSVFLTIKRVCPRFIDIICLLGRLLRGSVGFSVYELYEDIK